MQTGGIGMSLEFFADSKDMEKNYRMFGVNARALYEKTGFVFAMIKEILNTSKLTDEKRLHEILSEQKSRTQMRLTAAGHSTTALRSMAYFSESSAISDLTSGIAYYELLEELDKNFEEKKAFLIEKLQGLMKLIFRQDNLILSVTAEEMGLKGIDTELAGLKEVLAAPSEDFAAKSETEEKLANGKKNEGFQTSAKIQYVTRSGNYRNAGFAYTGALRILKVILSYEYLWMNVRVKGGAYGCMSGFGRNGDAYFSSYRDPNLRKTNEIYEGVPEYVENFTVEEYEELFEKMKDGEIKVDRDYEKGLKNENFPNVNLDII